MWLWVGPLSTPTRSAVRSWWDGRVGRLMLPDNTNADAETRAVWINLARKLDCPIRCIVFTASARVCEHNDTFRALHVGQEVGTLVYAGFMHDCISRRSSECCTLRLQNLGVPGTREKVPCRIC